MLLKKKKTQVISWKLYDWKVEVYECKYIYIYMCMCVCVCVCVCVCERERERDDK